MASFDIVSRLDRLRAVNLTIREQTRLASNPMDLRWQALAPRRTARSLKIRDLSKRELRLTAEYRAWNANGRELFEEVGPMSEWEILPLTAQKHFDEKRLLEFSLPDPTVQQLVDNGVIGDVDEWAQRIADAVHRRLEASFFNHWFNNQFTAMDPVTGSTITTGLNFDATRYVTEASAWVGTAGATGAFTRLVHHVKEATRIFGTQPAGVRMRQAIYDLIVASAPAAANNVTTTDLTVQDRLRERNINTRLIVDERTYHRSTDGGTGYAETYYVPLGKVAFHPAPGGVIGSTPSVPASRGGKEISGDRRVNLEEVTIWHSQLNRGMSLLLEGENIAVPMNDEERTYVVDTLVT